jgi:hypothetical protein
VRSPYVVRAPTQRKSLIKLDVAAASLRVKSGTEARRPTEAVFTQTGEALQRSYVTLWTEQIVKSFVVFWLAASAVAAG